ncbi:hypothetical protein PIB30_097557 [Stylosanthes scabra]|uniref:Uncharacterized protein n=1 Tax=Stylosanthes scabra TaxID=79078 RepID=A0ABU6ZVT5_9FABA|nr:hypothetical protein [Stylosanthes scabra]
MELMGECNGWTSRMKALDSDDEEEPTRYYAIIRRSSLSRHHLNGKDEGNSVSGEEESFKDSVFGYHLRRIRVLECLVNKDGVLGLGYKGNVAFGRGLWVDATNLYDS